MPNDEVITDSAADVGEAEVGLLGQVVELERVVAHFRVHPLDAGEVCGDAGLEWLQLEEGEEVGDEADQVEAHRVVQVDKVLD